MSALVPSTTLEVCNISIKIRESEMFHIKPELTLPPFYCMNRLVLSGFTAQNIASQKCTITKLFQDQ